MTVTVTAFEAIPFAITRSQCAPASASSGTVNRVEWRAAPVWIPIVEWSCVRQYCTRCA